MNSRIFSLLLMECKKKITYKYIIVTEDYIKYLKR